MGDISQKPISDGNFEFSSSISGFNVRFLPVAHSRMLKPAPAISMSIPSEQLPESAKRVYRYEKGRAVASGILEAAGHTFLLLIATTWFHSGPIAKGLVVSGGSVGLLMSPWVVWLTARLGWRPNEAANRLFLFGALCLIAPSLLPLESVFVIGSMVGMAMSSASIPLFTQIYHENYPAEIRGKLFSRTVMIRISSLILFGYFIGEFLEADVRWFRWTLFFFAIAFLWAGFCASQCKATPIENNESHGWNRSLVWIKRDRRFFWILTSWMLIGFSNLMTLPLRIEVLHSDRYGFQYSPADIALIVVVIPSVVRLIFSSIWGWLFDRINFFTIRIMINLGLCVAIVLFFTSGSWTQFIVSACIYGIMAAGADVAWHLWVTKIAPPERIADYMAAHTFLTGIRGALGPIVGFVALEYFSKDWIPGLVIVLVLSACYLLVPEWKSERRRHLAR